ncbi:hypothetical protein BT93_F3300 [Corymbia citriodora subsp. variegata]|nr:hypothetical protein BT93_F3300 [Corymbia citriodora subsp. variegata]
MNMRDITYESITCQNECTIKFHQRYNKLFHALNDQLRISYSVSNQREPNCKQSYLRTLGTNSIYSDLLKGMETS